MHFVDDAVARISQNNFWFHNIVSGVFADGNGAPRSLRLPIYTEAERFLGSVCKSGLPQLPP